MMILAVTACCGAVFCFFVLLFAFFLGMFTAEELRNRELRKRLRELQ